jgi:hypothetical protein
MSVLLGQSDESGGPPSDAEFQNMFWLFAVAGNEILRNGLPGGLIAGWRPTGRRSCFVRISSAASSACRSAEPSHDWVGACQLCW